MRIDTRNCHVIAAVMQNSSSEQLLAALSHRQCIQGSGAQDVMHAICSSLYCCEHQGSQTDIAETAIYVQVKQRRHACSEAHLAHPGSLRFQLRLALKLTQVRA